MTIVGRTEIKARRSRRLVSVIQTLSLTWKGDHKLRGPSTLLSSNSVVGQRMAISFAIEHPDCLVDGIIEVVWTGESLVSKMMLLQIAPELFDVVELRR